MSLVEDILIPKTELSEFYEITSKILYYFPNVINEETTYLTYTLCSSNIAGTRKQIRPFNTQLFLRNPDDFASHYDKFISIIDNLKEGKRSFNLQSFEVVDKVIYTMQQAVGIGLDLLVESNSARKHVGNKFEELMKSLLSKVEISLKKIVINIPYETEEGEKFYKCETDVVVSPFKIVKSNSRNIDKDELIISLKTTTKDRMPKIFIDKILLENFLQHPVKVVGIIQNDIQRKGKNKISYTFVSNLFMVYTKFLVGLEGFYYLDRPARAYESPFDEYVYPFSQFLLRDIWKLLGT